MVTEADWNKKLTESKNPFGGDNVLKDVWINQPDVESVNGSLTKSVLNFLSEVKTSSKMMVVQGQTGIGKTHFIARLRRLSKANNFLFVVIPPVSERTSIFSHIYREIFVSLRTPQENEKFNEMEKLISYILANSLIKIFKEKKRASQITQSNHSNLISFMEKLESEPTILLKNVDSNSTVLEFLKQISEISIANIEREFPRVDLTFLTVLFKTLDKDLRIFAMRWLEGIEQDDDVLSKLGVKKSISDEGIAQRVLYSIFILSNKPLLICFDQIESLRARYDDGLIIAFFDILVDIVDRTPNTLILLMALAETWADYMMNLLQRSVKARISSEASLINPSPEEMIKIVEERLKSVWGIDPSAPELKTYPFSHNYIDQLSNYVGKNPRHVLNHLKVKFQQMKEYNSFSLLDKFEHSAGIDQKNVTNEEFIDSQFKDIIKKYKTDPEDVSFASKETYLRDGLLDLFKGLKDQKIPINGLIIENVTIKNKSNEIDLILNIKSQNKSNLNLGIEICNNENGNRFNNILKMIQNTLREKKIDNWVMIRDINIPVKSSWVASIDLLKALSSNGLLYNIDVEDDASIYACKKILDLASSGDLELNRIPITRKDVMNFLLNNIIPILSIINPIFYSREPGPENGGGLLSSDKDEIKEKILSVANKKMMVIVNKLFSDFNEKKEYYKNIVKEMELESKLIIMIETDKKLVVSKPPSERVL